MSDIAVVRTEHDARRHVTRIRLTAGIVRENLPKLHALIEQAKESGDDQLLGYASWTAYVSDVLSDEPMRLPREERQELVSWLSGEGLSTRAIAPIVGVDKDTVRRDLQGGVFTPPQPSVVIPEHVFESPNDEGDGFNPTPNLTPGASDWSPEPEADPTTGELIEDAPPRTVTGLDGKTYTKPEPKPRAESKPSSELSLVNDIRLYLNALGSSPEVAQLSPAAKEHIINALKNTIAQIQENNS